MNRNHSTSPDRAAAKLEARSRIYARPLTGTFVLAAGLVLFALGVSICVSYGAADIKLGTVWEAIFRFDSDSTPHQIIRELRLPRVLGGALVGVCYAVSGAIMQGMTRNPLADSSLLGLNAGAGFVLALCFAFFPGMPYRELILFAFLGAAAGAVLVFAIGSAARGGLSPLRLILAGSAITALLTALSEGVALYHRIGQDLAFWYAGGVAGIEMQQLKIMAPWVGGALLAALILSRSITMLSLGDDVARGLGLRTGLVKLLGTVIVVVMAGAAVSLAGAISFVGLLVPHLTRRMVGVDYRWIIPCSAIVGGLLVMFADLAGRMVVRPSETQVSVLIAIIGVPFFLYLAAREEREL